MNFTIMNRNSMAGTVYTDRPSYQICSIPEPWKNPHKQHPHLNPSKSKVNVRSSLNKSGESFSLSNPNLDNVKGSCIVSKPPKASFHNYSRQSLFEEKYALSGKQNNDMSFQANTKDSFIKFSNMNRTYLFEPQERKKSDSAYLRSSLKETTIPKFQGDSTSNKDDAKLEDLKDSILALTKRVFLNEQEISKLKDKKEKEKKMQTLEHEFTQFQIQMFDICKKNTNYFSEFEDKIDKNNRQINQIKDRISFNPEKSQEREDLNRKIHLFQERLNEIQDKFKLNEDFPHKNITSQINMEHNMKNYISEQMSQVKLKLDKQTFDSNEIMVKIRQLERDIMDSKFQEQSYKRDNRICGNPIIIERKQSVTIKNNNLFRQKINIPSSSVPNKEIRDEITREKKEIVIKQNIYYIDSQGYLLDEHKYYLLNSKNEHILIPEHLLITLRNYNMLVSSPAIQQQ